MARSKKKRNNQEIKGNRKKDLNPIRGTQMVIDPEKGPENRVEY